MTFEDGVLKTLDLGEGNARQVTERLESQVRRTLNRPADDGKIQRYEPKVEETKKTYRLHPRPKATPLFKVRKLT